MHKFVGAVMAVLVLGVAEGAMALPGDPGEPVEREISASLKLTGVAPGSVTGVDAGGSTVVNCAADCEQALPYQATCEKPSPSLPERCSTDGATTVTLTATRAGWSPQWSGCTPVAGSKCEVTVTRQDQPVSLTWVDAQKPSVVLVSPPQTIGPGTVVKAAPSDNVGIKRVEFFVNGVKRADAVGPNFEAPLDLNAYAHSSTHRLTVVAVDTADNRSDPVPTLGHEFTIDKATSFTITQPPPAHTNAAPTIGFSLPPDFHEAYCWAELPFISGPFGGACGPTFTPSMANRPDGEWTVDINLYDDYGNFAFRQARFILDRGQPELDVTTPASGTVLTAPFTPEFTKGDQWTPDGEVDVQCAIDSGAFGSCSSLAPSADGPHTLKVRARDLAGNQRVREIPFIYDAQAPVVAIGSGPSEGATVPDREVTFGFSVTDATAVTKACKVDSGAFGNCTGDTSHQIERLQPGRHSFTLRAIDSLGRATEVSRTFTVSDAPPTAGTQTPGQPTPQPRGDGQSSESPPVAAGRSAGKFAVRGGRTRIKKLMLTGLAPGSAVAVTCSGKGCFSGTKRLTARRATLNLTSLFKKRSLRAGATIDVVVTRSGHAPRTFRYVTRKGKKKPLLSEAAPRAGRSAR